ncbi:MAG: 1-acyl-sn-glycerol-3-phosphate acyltransferase [Brevinematales bacterium]|nr:1-acyl-sn-glycerol-3-phosphate acyltransferase [Brevinematales bacterium]
MNIISRSVYEVIKFAVKSYLDVFMEFKVWGKENIDFPGPKIYCSNHFSSTDPFFVITLMKEPVHMIIGPGFSVPIFKTILKWGEQINALSIHRKTVVDKAVKFLEKGESVYIFPEGDLNDQSNLMKFYTGVAKIYLRYHCPVVPIGLAAPKSHVKEKSPSIKVEGKIFKTKTVLSGKYFANIGKPLYFSNEQSEEEITEIIKKQIENLISDLKTNKFWE